MCFSFLFLYLGGILHQYSVTDAATFTRFAGRRAITIEAKSKEFVEEIKEELTNNNDDYLKSSPLTPSPPRVRMKGTWNQHRRASEISEATSTSTITSLSSISITPTKVEFATTLETLKTVDQAASSCSLEKNAIDSKEKKPKANDVIEEDNNVSWLKEQTSAANPPGLPRVINQEPTSTRDGQLDTATTLKLVKGKMSRKPHKARKSKSKVILNSLLKDPSFIGKFNAPPPNFRAAPEWRHHQRAAVARADLALSRELPPDSKQLDMAPALGARVDNMRFKNRLCQRNVLVPEGPKYDSRGRVYLAAHSPRSPAADCARTRPRRLVLPRCCNCCKKSVLGCE